ncbi:DEAD/DEAH box helicase [Luteococcus sp. OSA5]|uniref:DEAD/DEAH box helicase n=1 Tax=Luteococcus sp. OSA5 TaxID=3401630 RepID=UPI003B42D2B8
MRLIDQIPALGPNPGPDAIYEAFTEWAASNGITLYPHQDEAILEILSGNNAIVMTPTGSGKSLIAIAAHFATLATNGVSFYTAPIKALVSEKFFALCEVFGATNVGMVTGDASVNADAPIICCTAEILANIGLREGREADVSQVVMDEYHFVADPDRGWAWQVGVTELPQAQQILMSATLGDVSQLRKDLTRRSGRETAVIDDAQRPVPLTYRWAMTSIHETVEEIVATGQAPVYIVHSTQAAALERAQALLSAKLVTTEERHQIVAAIGHFRFAGGFGQTLSKLVKAGIGVHHAGMLPRYRRLVETLAQQGLLKVICGTDTLGVGINVPIRTVLFTALSKFDGRRMRILRSREFHQIAGRAGRAGYDTIGYVVAQAPEHVVENEKALAKAGDDPKKRRKVQRKKPPEGFVNYTEESFQKLVNSVPETLHARMRITNAMLLNLLERDEDTAQAVVNLIEESVPDEATRRKLKRRAVALGRSLLQAGVVTRLDPPDPSGRRYELAVDLQDNFALNQPLSAFAMAAFELLDPEDPDYALDLVSIIEATLEDPMFILIQQQYKARGEAVAEMKADGYDYDERMEALEEVEWPKPLAELLDQAYETYRPSHPWIAENALSPKSIVRDMYERAMTFGEYVAFYKVQRSEGLLLRYLSDAYRALRQSVPERFVTEELTDLVEWLGELIRLTDSSLLDEWEALTDPEADPEDRLKALTHPTEKRHPVTGNERAFTVLVRNALWRHVELMADDKVDELAELDSRDPNRVMDADAWDEALGNYWDEHDDMGLDADARGPRMLRIEKFGGGGEPRTWRVAQIIDDPDKNHDWQLQASINLDDCDEAGELVLHVLGFSRVD